MFSRIVIFIVFILLMSPVMIMAQNETMQNTTSVFTNEDIEKYKKPSDTKPVPSKTDRAAEKKEKAQKIREEHEKEYWCKKAAQHRKKIDIAKETIAEAEKEDTKTARKKVANAKKQLKYAEQDLLSLEDEAHRKGIPPGWLRCQFE